MPRDAKPADFYGTPEQRARLADMANRDQPIPPRITESELDAAYEADVTAVEVIDLAAVLRGAPRWRVLLDAEGEVIALVPAEKAAVIVNILNEAPRSYPFAAPEDDEL